MLFPILVAVYVTVLGLIVGSYLNVVIHRLPRGLSTVRPRSRCPECGAAIRAYDNLPVVSYLVLRGKCRSCGAPISWRYPAIEALTGLLFCASFLRFGFQLATPVACLFCCLMIVLAGIDIEHMLLPDRITLPGIAVGLLVQLAVPLAGGILGGALGAVLGGGILFAISMAWLFLRGEEGMGLGDVKMLAMVGAFLGWKGVVVTLFASTLTGAIVGLAVARKSQAGMKAKLPFGAFLAFAALVALFFGTPLVDAYLGLLK